MPHIAGHKEKQEKSSGLMSNPYQQAAASMQQAGLSSVGDIGVKEREKISKKNPSYVPPQSGGTITESNPQGPVNSNGSGKWNAGYEDDEESKKWTSMYSFPGKTSVLDEVVSKYNQSWLGAHNKYGNFEDDLPLTQAIKWGSNFLLRASTVPVEMVTAKYIGDPAANIYEELQDAGYVSKTGTQNTLAFDPVTGTYVDPSMVIGDDIELKTFTQPSPHEFGMGAKTTAEIGGAIYSIPSLLKFGVQGVNAVKNIFSKNAKIKPANVLKIDSATTKEAQAQVIKEWNTANPDNQVTNFVDLQAASTFVKQNPKYLYHQFDDVPIGKDTNNFGIITDANKFVDDVETEIARIILSNNDESVAMQTAIKNLDPTLTKQVLVFDGNKNVVVKIPKIYYHGTSKNFMKFDSNAPKTHSDIGGFNGVSDNIYTAQYYAMHKGGVLKDAKTGDFLKAGTDEEEALDVLEQIYETPKIITGTLNVKKLWKLGDENDVELMAHIAATKKWNADNSPSSIAVVKESSKGKENLTLDDFVENPTYNQRYEANLDHLNNNDSPWALIEDNINYLKANHGYDAFQTKEVNRVNIMLTDPDNQLVPIHNYLRDKNIQTKEWGNGFETKVNWVEDLSQWNVPITKTLTEHRGSFAIEMVM